jgi:AmmeMemoRadiSam system protein B
MDIRPSPLAGTWYPGKPEFLTETINRYLQAARGTRPGGRILGVIVPHAGYRYSGRIAAQAFACLEGLSPELVVVVAPYHHEHPAPVLTSGHSFYQTPLGSIPIDLDAVNQLDQKLYDYLGIRLERVKHDPEHALEIELPFLQHVLGEFNLLPIMVRDQRPIVAMALGTSLANLLAGRDALLVASSDLSHFYPQETANILDTEILARITAYDPEGIFKAETEGRGFACGRSAIAAVMWAARELGADEAQVTGYGTSGEETGDFEKVVGYGSAVLLEGQQVD